MDPRAKQVFEISWEVCNKVGGIYTVISSKAAQIMRIFKNEYYLVGPYFPKKTYGIFEETPVPEKYKISVEKLKKEGLEIHYGKWLVKGDPNVFLIDFSKYTANKNEIKKYLWDAYKIDSLQTEYFDFDEPLIWSWAAGRLIEELTDDVTTIAHAHEWLAAPSLLYLKSKHSKAKTVFTTHATTLGRVISSENKDLYAILDKINPDEEAKKRGPGVNAKYQLEKSTANAADVFTTVSEITGIEAEKILGRKADVLLLNGLDMAKFPTFEEASLKHHLFKQRIKTFLLYYFFPYYTFDLDNTLFFFIAGRYEFHDKGIDIFIKALGELNKKLKDEKCVKTIITFFFIPGNVKGIKQEILENRTFFTDIKDMLDDEKEDIFTKILQDIVSQKEISKKSLFDADSLDDLKRKTLRLLRKGLPPAATHDLADENNDNILNALKSAGLNNDEESKVKVISYPIYLSGADNLLDTTYYESMMGCHLGVFPSVYEPWGYTPLEAAALGVSSITTDLSGFGRYLCTECNIGRTPGIFVLKRYGKQDIDAVSQLTEFMLQFAHFTTQERAENKVAARKLASTADWEKLIERYVEAYDLAIGKNIKKEDNQKNKKAKK